MNRRRKITIAVLGAVGGIVVVCALGVYILLLGLTEDLYFNKWSVAYVVFTPAIVDNVPQPQRVGEVEYYHSCGDGPKPMAEGISYETEASNEVLLTEFHNYLSAHGYVKDTAQTGSRDYNYSKDDKTFTFEITPEKPGTNRVVVRLETF